MLHQHISKTRLPRRISRGLTGFSLIEVLIAIVVLSFGLLGVAGLQAASLKYGRVARQQSTAVSLARELAEMMRANPIAATKATSNPYYGDFSGASIPAVGTTTCLDVGSACTTSDGVASAQLDDWLIRVGEALPEVRVVICADSAPYNTTSGLPVWACTAPSAGDTTAIIKLGWTQETTDSTIQATGDTGARPFVVLPVVFQDLS